MPEQSSRKRFIRYLLFLLAAAFLLLAIFRVVDSVQDHQRPGPSGETDADAGAYARPSSSGVKA